MVNVVMHTHASASGNFSSLASDVKLQEQEHSRLMKDQADGDEKPSNVEWARCHLL
jgi:hypothetical protein